MKQPDASIVRITDAQGNTRGTGFVVSADGMVATCQHVVEGIEPMAAFRGGESQPVEVVKVDPIHDVAFVRWAAALPAGAAPVELAASERREGAALRAFGYPNIGDIQGLWGAGQLVGYVTEGGQTLLQIGSSQITQGFSGGPVWDAATGRVLGMVVQIALADSVGRLDDVAFAIPAETIYDQCPAGTALYRGLRQSVPFQAPAVPRYFVPRPEASNDLKARLLASESLPAGALVVSAMHGMGGIGKTTLAAALAHDPELQARFPDGILWVTLGQQPDVLALLAGWIQALHDFDFRPTAVESASNHLRTLLHGKDCLLVVDDAWQADYVRPFLVGGDRCRVLVTTRDAILAHKVGAGLYDLDVMTEAQALSLFTARLGPLKGNLEEAATLARELGYLPLALELAAAAVEAGMPWGELLGTFQRELADLAALDLDEATYRNESLRLSFRLSLERLLPTDQEAFAWVGVLAEDSYLNPSMAAILWNEPEGEARKRLRRLWSQALLSLVSEGHYAVHDLLHDEAKSRLVEQMALPKAHAALLERYKVLTHGGQWHTVPQDGYIHTHLTWHMEQAKQLDEMHTLLREETPGGRNAWYKARVEIDHHATAGYMSDVRRAWEAAARDRNISLQVRYALITSSMHSLAQGLPMELLVGILQYKSKLMSPATILSTVRQLPRVYERADALHDLAPYLPEWLLSDALEMALDLACENERALLGLAPFLTPTLAEKALLRLPKATNDFRQAWFLSAVAPTLPDTLLPLGLATGRQIRDPGARAVGLSSLVGRLSDDVQPAVIAETLEAAAAATSLSLNAGALLNLAQYISKVQITDAWQAVSGGRRRTLYDDSSFVSLAEAYAAKGAIEQVFSALEHIESGQYRYEAISRIAHRLGQADVARLLDYLPRDAFNLDSAKTVGNSLGTLAKYADSALKHRLLELARSMDSTDECRLIALASIAHYTDQDDVKDGIWADISVLLERLGRHWDDWHVAAYEEIVDYLPLDLVEQFMEAPREKKYRQQISLASLHRLPPPARDRVCAELYAEALDGALKRDMLLSTHPLAALAPYISEVERETLYAAVLEKATTIKDRSAVEHTLVPLQALVSCAWVTRLRNEGDVEHDHVRVLLTMAPYALRSADMAHLALGALDALDPNYFEYTLWELAPLLRLLGAEERANTLSRVLDVIDTHLRVDDSVILWSDDARVNIIDALHLLLSHTNGEERQQVVWHVVAKANKLRNRAIRASLLAVVFSHLPESAQHVVLAEFVQWLNQTAERPRVQKRRYGSPARALALAYVAMSAEPGEREALLAAASRSLDRCEPGAIIRAASFLPAEVAGPILGVTTAEILRDDAWGSRLTACLWLPAELRVHALLTCLRAITKTSDPSHRDYWLIAMVCSWLQLPKQDMYRIWAEVLPALAQGNRWYLLADLHATAAVLLALGGDKVVAETMRAIHDVSRWWP